MAMKPLLWLIAAAVTTSSCGRSDDTASEREALAPLSVTRWTDKTEVFAEYPPLVVGQTSRFAIHLTDLRTFKAVTTGGVEVQLHGGSAPEIFRTEAPSRPGIFGVDVQPSRAGTRVLVIALRSSDLSDEHRISGVTVYTNESAARTAVKEASEEGEGISFLKEQQWALDFGTTVVVERAIRESIRVPAEIVARPGGAAEVVAPIDGRLTRVTEAAIGGPIAQGQELARLLPAAIVPGDLPQLEQARAEAIAALSLATRDRERAERLVSAGAAPQKRLEEARAAETQAIAQRRAAEAQLSVYHAARSGVGGGDSSGLFNLRAPISGVLASRQATTGANVTAGSTLFQIVDVSHVHVSGRIPEAQAPQGARITAAEIEVAGREPMPIQGRATSLGKVLDPNTRTLPIVFSVDNRVLRLPLGQAVFLRLFMNETASTPVVPVSAIVDDAGRPILFVQISGESFERRPVRLGAREGEVVQILEGAKPGERIVSKGAYLVRLASLSTQVPAHGHVH